MDNVRPSIITRFGEPSKSDTAQHSTICRVSNSPDSFDIYLQISHDEENPNWILMGQYHSSISDQDILNDIHNKNPLSN